MNYVTCIFQNYNFFEFKLRTAIINFIFVLFLYFFNLLNIKIHTLEPFGSEVELTYSLIKTTINEVPVLYSQSFKMSYVTKALEFIQQYHLNTNYNNVQYNISKFKRIDGSYFNTNSCFNHYNIFISCQEYNNTLWMHQLTHNLPKKQELRKIGFEYFLEKDILFRDSHQYVSSIIRIVDSTYIEEFNDGKISDEDLMEFMVKNKLNIINHFKTSIKIN